MNEAEAALTATEQRTVALRQERDEAWALVATGFTLAERDRLEACVESANVEHAYLTERAVVAEVALAAERERADRMTDCYQQAVKRAELDLIPALQAEREAHAREKETR